MTRKVKLLKKVYVVRKRLRDAAAGAAGAAEARRLSALEEEGRVESELTLLLDSAEVRLAEAEYAKELALYDNERQLARELYREAAKISRTLTDESDRLRARLQERERALRSSEKLLDQTQTQMERAQLKAEQKVSDDLSSARAMRGQS